MFAVWRSCQHYASPASLPDAQALSLEKILSAAHKLPAAGRSRRYVARMVDEQWSSVGFIQDGALVSSTTTAQLRKYDKVRRGEMKWSNDKYTPLTDADHPQRSRNLDLE